MYTRRGTTRATRLRKASVLTFALLAATLCDARADEHAVAPSSLKAIGTIDARFQSYNVEMVEITGGRFWKSYPRNARAPVDRHRYGYRPPIDLTNRRLRNLASALAPAYMRVSGTWANATYFADDDHTPSAPPSGFNTVLTRAQWRGVIEFARAANAEIVTSFAVSPGSRDAQGAWTPDRAQRLLAYAQSLGGRIAAAEFMNEPTLSATNGPPRGYDATAYGRDFKIFRDWIKRASPDTLILGPGSAGDTASPSASGLSARALLTTSGAGVDRFSYHHYFTLSPRCGVHDDPAHALTENWLSRTDDALTVYRALRDEFEPEKPLWLTETANAACGGSPWDPTFLDTFRYLDQLGRLARAGVQVVMHNTLAASDYGLLDERDFHPRPNYWGALLWRRLMGTTVLDVSSPATDLHLYAHCHPAMQGAVSLLAINTSRRSSRSISIPLDVRRYTLDAARLESATVRLNGKTLALAANDELPRLDAQAVPAGVTRVAPASITFLVIPDAANPACP
ncbi:hypothetical protein JQ596_31485 [Bradyrhizobium manausense]|uniref:hypothetical protein n=1 Tax=Bradyrhizobium TaxID=374 RepID=UPI001BACC12C|nr:MULTISPECIES: hypothetical protein [Bradyrhizobium]MBR0830060.1 hypothetical protein [Bradyrhizobium manausense]UVO30962.1 hypothetical protein KUF59_10115 [Bradyrhizobium arachidis]